MKTLLPRIALCLVPLLATSCSGETTHPGGSASLAKDYPIELLEGFAVEALEAVRAILPTEVESVSIRFVESAEMEEILLGELRPQMAMQFEDAEVAEKTAVTMASAMEKGLIAKTVVETGEIVVVRENLFQLAELLGEPALATEQALKAVIVHEVVHVIDNHADPLGELFGTAQDADGLQAINAVIEGHAQFIARQANRAMGNSDAFELFTKAIGMVPPSEDPIELYMSKIVASGFQFAYHNGELFFDQLAAADPALGFEQVLGNLPLESVLIFEPQWYLDPSQRPRNQHDFEAAFTTLEEHLESQEPEAWSSQASTLLTPQIEAALSIVPKENYETSLKEIIECQVMMARNTGKPGTMVAAGLFAMTSVPAAGRLMDLQVEILAAKKEQLTGGSVKITDSLVRELTEDESDWLQGQYFRTEIMVGERPIYASGILAWRGDVVLELNFVGWDVDLSDAIPMAELLLGHEPAAEEE